MPEEDKATTPAEVTTSPGPAASQYRRVYPDWKPSTTLEKADVVGTIEAIADAAAGGAGGTRDKSAWRKSNLNSEDATESYSRRVMRQRSREATASGNNSTTSPLHSIVEEDRRKSVIHQLAERPASDRLQIYIRRPSDAPVGGTADITDLKSPISVASLNANKSVVENPSNSVTSDHHSIYIRPSNESSATAAAAAATAAMPNVPRRLRRGSSSSPDDVTPPNKSEIDSDNIETPPTQRRQMLTVITTTAIMDKPAASSPSPCRKLQTPRPLHKKTIEENHSRNEDDGTDGVVAIDESTVEKLGDGQFDRHSSMRRTRRYKRPTTDATTVADDSNDRSSPPQAAPDSDPDLESLTLPKIEDKDARLKRWQERLKSLDNEAAATTTTTTVDTKPAAIVKVRVGKVGRNLSSINQEDVREAIRNLKSPTETPERIWSPQREIVREPSTKSAQHHELNDEGFEETQSLVSDTPSHGKDSTSSCNEQTEKAADVAGTATIASASLRLRPLRMTSSDSAASSETASKRRTTNIIIKPVVGPSLLERNRQSLERSRSLRIPSTSSTLRTSTAGALPKRTNSLRRGDAPMTVKSRVTDVVERSGSRTSLRSSRSSLNSSASTKTVVRSTAATAAKSALPTRTPTMSLEKSMYKKPLTPSPANTPLAASPVRSRMPASRSSSSGSSIGPSSVRRAGTSSTSPKAVVSSTSFKENQASPIRYNGRGANNNNHNGSISNHNNNNNNNSSSLSSAAAKITARLSTPPAAAATSKIQSVSNFMRPTAASSTKFSGAKGK